MSELSTTAYAVLAGIAAAPAGIHAATLHAQLGAAGIDDAEMRDAVRALMHGLFVQTISDGYAVTSLGVQRLLEHYAALQAIVDPSPLRPDQELCPSVPWVTAVQTQWTEAVSINYAVAADALRPLLPQPLEPEIFHDTAWLQVLMSSLRDLRPQGMGGLFGVCFYQVSYRVAVSYVSRAGTRQRGGYFLRSDTNHELMRGIGNRLAEFRFHDFSAADMVMLREGKRLTMGVDPLPPYPHGKIMGVFDTTPSQMPPTSSVWRSLAELQHPLVECYDAYGVDAEAGYLYTLTIDRDPWNAHFATPQQWYCEYCDTGPLGQGAARLDSVLYLQGCNYRWRPLKRERLGA